MATVRKLTSNEYVLLLPILTLAFYMVWIPHQSYPYPVHLDEWNNMAYFQATINHGSVAFPDPWLGEKIAIYDSPWLGKVSESDYPNMEIGYHLFWASFHQITGIEWLTVFRYFPSIIFMITVLSVFIMARREGFGLEAAFFTCFIPTTVGVLGPAFMVPMAMGLLFIPLYLFIAFNHRTWQSYVVLFVLMCLLLAFHAPTAVGLFIILMPYILLNLKSNFKHSLLLGLTAFIPFVVIFPWIFDVFQSTLKTILNPVYLHPYVDYLRLIQVYGYLPLGICLIGTFVMALRRDRKSYSLALGLLALLLMLVTYRVFHRGIGILYERGLTYSGLMICIVAGAGLTAVRKYKLTYNIINRFKLLNYIKNTGIFLCLVVVGLTLFFGIPTRQDIKYYRMIDDEDYQAFIWIRDNVDKNYETAVLDPWKATAFTAITSKMVYSRITVYPLPNDAEATVFLTQGCIDTAFLTNNMISIVYTRDSCVNDNLIEVRKNVYLLKSDQLR